MLMIDSKEKRDTKDLMSFVAGPAHIMSLNCADFLLVDRCDHSLGIERKAISDLLNSLSHRNSNGNVRLFDQLARMKEAYSHRMLLVEGGIGFNAVSKKVIAGKRDSGWHHGSVQAMLWAIQAEGTSLMFTDDKHATADLLRVLHARAMGGCVLPKALRDLEMEVAA